MTTATIDNIAWIINDEEGGIDNPVFEDVVELEEHEYAMIFPDNGDEEVQEPNSNVDSDYDSDNQGELSSFSSYLRAYLVNEWNSKSNRATLP